MLLADDFYRIAHDHVNGRPRLHPRAMGVGLAAALLGELSLEGKISVGEKGRVFAVSHRPPADALAHTVLDHVRAESQHTVRTWLVFLGQTAHQEVRGRLVRTGHVRVRRSGRLIKTVKYVPSDWNVAGWPAARLTRLLAHGESMSADDAFLSGLVSVSGLEQFLLRDVDNPGYVRGYMQHLIEHSSPLTRELLMQTRAAIGDAVLSHRV